METTTITPGTLLTYVGKHTTLTLWITEVSDGRATMRVRGEKEEVTMSVKALEQGIAAGKYVEVEF